MDTKLTSSREYVRTHPWITFSFDTRRLSHVAWMQLGEIVSKAQHIANAPIDPVNAEDLYDIFLAKGAAATTAIEGNTLSEDQVRQQLSGELDLPPSQEYLQIEVQNVIDACNGLISRSIESDSKKIDIDFIKNLNQQVLQGLELEEGVIPGELRRHSVVVAGYRGAPSEDCYFLLEQMLKTLDEILQSDGTEKMVGAVFGALFVHAYIAIIHPFGDGNGRTSRLLEVYILFCAGFPMPTCQLLSNHYNMTRSAYYRQLDAISKNGGELVGFTEYALQGFVDGLREQVTAIQNEQVRVIWVNHIHAKFANKVTEAGKRRRDLALAISQSPLEQSMDDILSGSQKLARVYTHLDPKTLTRDINVLVGMDLVVKLEKKKLRPKLSVLRAFLPWKQN